MKKSDKTKQFILLNATKQFYNNGYELTSTKQLAQESNVSEGLIFKYFNTKKGLLQAVIQQATEQLKSDSIDILKEILETNLTYQEKLLKLLNNRIDFFDDHTEVLSIIMQQTHHDSTLRLQLQQLILNHVDPLLSNLIKMGIEEGAIKENADTDFVISSIKSILFEILFVKTILRIPYNREFINKKVDLLLKGVLT